MSSRVENHLSTEEAQVRRPGASRRWLVDLILEYEDLLRSAADWHWECDAEFRLTQVSEPLEEDAQIPPEIGLGRDLRQLGEFELFKADRPTLLECLEAQRGFRDVRIAIQRLGEAPLRYRLTGVPAFDRRSGALLGYRGTGIRLAEEAGEESAASEESQDQLIGLLERALARKDQLEWELSRSGRKSFESRIAAITHELRTPLNAIIGFAEIIKRRAFGDDLERYVDYGSDIYDSGMHMVALVDSLIDLAKVEQREEQSEHRPLVVREFVSRTLRMVEDQAADAGVTLVNQVRGDLPALNSEPRALRQILLNLLSNAIKYTRSGGIVGVEAALADERNVKLAVWDTGAGIPEEEQARIFERSYRVDDEINAELPGSGLGLAISQDLAQAIGGAISVESRPGEGSRFTVRLPLSWSDIDRSGAGQG